MRRLSASMLVMGVAACGAMNHSSNACRHKRSQPQLPQVLSRDFFVGHSVTMTPDARAIVATAAAARSRRAQIQVAGPNTKVTPHYDPGLAQPRIDLIVNALVADGVPKDKIVRTSLPSDKVHDRYERCASRRDPGLALAASRLGIVQAPSPWALRM